LSLKINQPWEASDSWGLPQNIPPFVQSDPFGGNRQAQFGLPHFVKYVTEFFNPWLSAEGSSARNREVSSKVFKSCENKEGKISKKSQKLDSADRVETIFGEC
jgi:hypothetical protein